MTDSCIFCETEPIDDFDWYKNEAFGEVICPACVSDINTGLEDIRNKKGYSTQDIVDKLRSLKNG